MVVPLPSMPAPNRTGKPAAQLKARYLTIANNLRVFRNHQL